MLPLTSSSPPENPRTLNRRAELFINRELSWLEFNLRVVTEAADESVPLFERLKFLAISASNLDEFFMVRVAGLQAQLSGEVGDVPADGMTPIQQLEAISLRAHELVQRQYSIWNQQLRPALRKPGSHSCGLTSWTPKL